MSVGFWLRLFAWSAVAYMASFHSRWFLYAALCLLFLGVEGQADINRRNGLR